MHRVAWEKRGRDVERDALEVNNIAWVSRNTSLERMGGVREARFRWGERVGHPRCGSMGASRKKPNELETLSTLQWSQYLFLDVEGLKIQQDLFGKSWNVKHTILKLGGWASLPGDREHLPKDTPQSG